MLFSELHNKINSIIRGIPGKASICITTNEGDLHIDSDCKIPAASLIKVPIMMAAYHKAEREGLDLRQLVPIDLKLRVGGMGVVTHLSADLTLPLEDLVTLMIIVSDNTATNFCIDAVGLDYINQTIAKFGCTNTILGRRLMDYEARSRGLDNWTSASDMVLMLREIWQGDKYAPSSKEKMQRNLLAQQFNTKLPRYIQYTKGTIVAHKTGEITGVEHDAAIIEVKGKTAYIAALLYDLSDSVAGQDALAEIGRVVWEYLA